MDLSKHLENAAEAVKRRNYPFAVKLYTQLLSLQPDNAKARAGLRTALFKKAEAKPPSRLFAMLGGGVHLVSGSIARMCRKHASAAKAYERYLVADPLHEAANLKLADSLAQAGYGDSARAVYQAYAEAQPRCVEAAVRAGALLYATGKFEPALEMYEQALAIDPRNQEALKARKNLAAEGALKATGLETAKGSQDLLKDKQTARKLERDDRLQLSADEIAIELGELEEKLEQEPGNVKALVRMADLMLMRNDVKGALACLEDASAQDPGNSDLGNRSGQLRLRLQEQRVDEAAGRGDVAAADLARKALSEARAAEYRRQVEQNPTDLRLRFELGKALHALGSEDAAIAEFQQSVRDPKVKGESLLLLGEAFAAKGMDDLAMGQLEKALEVVKDSGQKGKEVLYAMGCVAQNMGREDQALAHFSRILEQDIGFRDVQARIAALKTAS